LIPGRDTAVERLKRVAESRRLRSVVDFVRSEAAILGGIALASGLVWAFVQLADEVVEGDTKAVDNAVVMLFREPGNPEELIGPAWFEEMMRDVTALGSYACIGLLVAGVVGYLMLAGKRAAAMLVLVSVVSGSLLSTLLKLGYDRPRPDLTHVTRQFTSSFPSGHAMLSAIAFLTLGALLARLAPTWRLKTFSLGAAITLTLLVGMSRIYFGVHFPSDVLAGWCIGAAWALLCSLVALWLQRRGTVEEPNEPAQGVGKPSA
jgi:undecaprenyl-diphosphatase